MIAQVTIDAIRLILSVVLGGLAVEASVRLLARIHPQLYFSMADLLHGLGRVHPWRGLTIRLIIPFAAGAIVGLLNPEARGVAGAASAGLGALFTIWLPLIYDNLLPFTAYARKTEVRILYVLYLIAHLSLGFAGGSLAGLIMEEFGPSSIAQWFADAEIPASTEIVGGVISGIVGAALFSIVRAMISRLKGD